MKFKSNVPVKIERDDWTRIFIETKCSDKSKIKRLYIPLIGEVEVDKYNMPQNCNLVMSKSKRAPVAQAFENPEDELPGTVWLGVAFTDVTPACYLTIDAKNTTIKPLWVKRSRGELQSSIAFIAYLSKKSDKIVFNVGLSGKWMFGMDSLKQTIRTV